MSQDKRLVRDEHGGPRRASRRRRCRRRRFVQGLGAVAAIFAAGVIPALAEELVGSAGETGTAGAFTGVPGEQAAVLERIIDEDGTVNYPGHPVSYAKPAGDEKWAMVIDVKACVGCRKCVNACVKENNIGRNSGFTYIQVLEMEPGSIELESGVVDYKDGGDPEKWYLPVQCMQCAKPTCVYGCPVQGDLERARRHRHHRLREVHRLPQLHRHLPLLGTALQLG